MEEAKMIEKQELIKKAWSIAHAFLKDGNHDINHIRRVLNNAITIWETEGGNIFAIKLACILHDIGRPIERLTGEDHAKISAQIAKRLLTLWNVEEEIQKIVYDAIYNHRFSNKREPKTIEGKILSDADKIDAIGAIGIARVFKHNCTRPIEEDLQHFYEKILKLPKHMYTETGYKLATKRIKLVKLFIKQLEEEIDVVHKT